jgi:hypothetical protein
MSRRPGYETLDYTGRGYESRRETMAQRADGGIGRPRGAGAQAAGRGPDAVTRAARDELTEIEFDYMRRRMQLLELTAP